MQLVVPDCILTPAPTFHPWPVLGQIVLPEPFLPYLLFACDDYPFEERVQDYLLGM